MLGLWLFVVLLAFVVVAVGRKVVASLGLVVGFVVWVVGIDFCMFALLWRIVDLCTALV